MRLLTKKAPAVLGLDIGSSAVKLVELSYNGKRYHIESYAVEPVTPDAVAEQAIADIESVGKSIQRALKRAKARAKHAAVAVSGSAVISQTITLPDSLSDEEMAAQIELEAGQYIHYPLEEVNLDFEVIGPSAHNANMVDVLLIASRSENVESRVAALEMAGLKTKVVDVETYATENALNLIIRQMPGQGLEKTIAIVDIGATTTHLIVFDDLKIIYTREQVFGGKQLDEEIQRHYKLPCPEAQRAKKQGTLPADYASEVLAPFKESVARQVSRALQFFFSSSHYQKVDHILLAGGIASISGIAQLVASQIGTPVSIANPFIGMSVATRISAKAISNDAPALMVACGLALRSFD